MISLPGYKINSQIYESANSVVYRGIRKADNQPVILKRLKENYPSPQELTRYKQEYDLTRNLDLEGIIKAENLEEYQKTLVIIFCDSGGESLQQLIQQKKLIDSLPKLLEIASQITKSIGNLHSVNIIHKDINPANIIFNPSTEQIKIIDFGISTQLTKENPTLKNPNILEGTLPYISPEQTGRMNRDLDYRSDFYSLGVTLYELLTKQLPFPSNDPIEIVHSHIAKQPTTPHDINPEIPQTLSKIIIKLMAKTAEERYQSAWGIQADLEKCRSQLTTQGKISNFPLATQDISDKFQIPQKLYGREQQVATLLAAFQRVAAENQTSSQIEMMLVAGYSGIGKSALVKEVHKPITEKRGYFISGKFDQFQRNIPYSAIVAAFSDLVRQLLTETETQLQQWKTKLLTAIETNGAIIIDVIPEVELIIGEQPAVPILGPTESQNRFNLVFQNFIRAFCAPEHPLVIFLDDLQWADSATLKLIELMMADRETPYLLLLGSYRDNEVSSTHALTLTLEKLRSQQATINQIALLPLGSKQIAQLISDTLHRDRETVQPLAKLIKQKTGGNPFFVNQFMTTLHSENLLTFDIISKSWQWEMKAIEAIGITDNVVELMVRKLQKLPQATQKIGSWAACIGPQFSLTLLATIYGCSRRELYQQLEPIIQLELIVPISQLETDLLIENYRFLHDRVQQAAYSLLAEAEKPKIHYEIGQALWENSRTKELEEKRFEIADHLNLGVELATSQAEREALAKLNLKVSKKAKTATAYKAAINYIEKGIELLNKDSWESQYDLTLDLHIEGIEASYLSGNYEAMNYLFAVVLQKAKTLLDQIKSYEVIIQFYASQNQMQPALEKGFESLKKLGIQLVESPPEITNIEALLEREKLTDPTQLSALKILATVFAAVYIASPDLLPRLTFTMVNICLQSGNSVLAPMAYTLYGLVLCGRENNIELGYQCGQLARQLLERWQTREMLGKVRHVFYAFIQPWKQSIRESLEPLYSNIKTCADLGDLEFSGYSSALFSQYLFYSGTPLERVFKQQMTLLDYAKKKQLEFLIISEGTWVQLTDILSSESLSTQLRGRYIDETEVLPLLENGSNQYLMSGIYLAKTILCYLQKEFAASLANSKKTQENEEGATGSFAIAVNCFYQSLSLLALYPNVNSERQKTYIQQVEINQDKLKKWAENAPMNFQHKWDLVEAEKARIEENDWQAAQFYEQAIAGARDNRYLQEEALGYELAAEFYLSQRMEKIAQTYLKEARYSYSRWGALAKVNELETRYPDWLNLSSADGDRKITLIPGTVTNTLSGVRSTEALDLATVMKASQAISGEIVLDKLLAKLMNSLIENAGAQTGFLILDKQRSGKWAIEACGGGRGDRLPILQSIPIENHLPTSIINYVTRTRKTLVLNDCSCEGNFISDPYIRANQTKSILCAPLLNQTQLRGIIYLENNLSTGVFTPDRLQVLQLLSGQAAIALTNACLYQQLENYSQGLERQVEKRTAQLAEATCKAEAANEAKSSFLANMSHELRSPLNAILGFAQLMDRSHSLPPEHQENVSIISRSGEHLLALINQVLDLSKIEAGRTTLNEKDFDIIRMLEDLEEMFQLKANDRGLQLICDRPLDIPRYVRADELKLRQVLINLLNNALKFTHSGSVFLRVSTVEQQLTTDHSQQTLHFEVEDTGVGIAPEELDSVFEAFVQTSTGKQAPEGTGLGLAISRKFVQLMGGDINVRSRVGRGTTFKFDIQVTAIQAAEIETRKPKCKAIAIAPNQPRYRILIVDDNSINRQLLLKLLNPLGFELQQASNGAEALDIWNWWEPHLIWLDMRMPVMDGYEVTKKIKATAKGQATVIIALTASVLENEQAVVLSASCDDFLRKPFREEEILAMMNKHIGVRYICDEPTDDRVSMVSSDIPDIITSSNLAEMPVELLANLEWAANFADMKEIDRYIAEIRSYNATVADALEVLALDFEYSEIVRLIQDTHKSSISNYER